MRGNPFVASSVLFLGALRRFFTKSKVQQINATEARRLQQEEGAILLDVRERHEWRAGHAPQAMHTPLGNLERSLKALPRDGTIIVMCASGMRSRTGARTLEANGFPRVLNLAGGMGAWRSSRLPIEKDAK